MALREGGRPRVAILSLSRMDSDGSEDSRWISTCCIHRLLYSSGTQYEQSWPAGVYAQGKHNGEVGGSSRVVRERVLENVSGSCEVGWTCERRVLDRSHTSLGIGARQLAAHNVDFKISLHISSPAGVQLP